MEVVTFKESNDRFSLKTQKLKSQIITIKDILTDFVFWVWIQLMDDLLFQPLQNCCPTAWNKALGERHHLYSQALKRFLILWRFLASGLIQPSRVLERKKDKSTDFTKSRSTLFWFISGALDLKTNSSSSKAGLTYTPLVSLDAVLGITHLISFQRQDLPQRWVNDEGSEKSQRQQIPFWLNFKRIAFNEFYWLLVVGNLLCLHCWRQIILDYTVGESWGMPDLFVKSSASSFPPVRDRVRIMVMVRVKVRY